MTKKIKKYCLIIPLILFSSCTSVRSKLHEDKTTYSFTQDYFSQHIPVWEKMLTEKKGQKNLKYLELGVFEGRSFIWMMENILTDPTAEGVAVDFFPGRLLETFESNLRVSGQKNKVRILKGYFSNVLKTIKDESFDIIYLDGGHMSWTTLETTMLAWALLKQNGILIFDDYTWKDAYPAQFTPKLAVDAFLKSHRNFIEIIYSDAQVIVRRKQTACDNSPYLCFPLNGWAYNWGTKSLLNVEKQQMIKLSENDSTHLEKLLSSPRYTNAKDVVELLSEAKTDKALNLFLSTVKVP